MKSIKTGSILLEGKSIDTFSLHKRLGEGLVYVPEDRARNGIFSIASVTENITAACLQQNNRFLLAEKRKRFSEVVYRPVSNCCAKHE